jgi:hypothetical protein
VNTSGQSVDQYGRLCSTATTGCVYNPATGTWTLNGVVSATCQTGAYGGGSYLPGQLSTGAGCTYWDQVYPGNYYIPVDLGGGNIKCMNTTQFATMVPDYQNYYTNTAQTVYAVACPYDAWTCQYGFNGGGSWSAGGSTCIGIATSTFDSYGDYYDEYGYPIGGGTSGFMGMCF